MRRVDLAIVGAGPAGLSAAIEAGRHGMKAVVFDENDKPGGQLFKQIHKFFGSKEHRAKERGFRIGHDLLADARELGVEVSLGATVLGVHEENTLTVLKDGRVTSVKPQNVIIATGASENVVPFPGWTLPGVIGAGAAQTMANLHGVRPGERVLMLGCGNVGVVVAFQLLQAGSEVVAMVDASPRIGGYGVHAAKVARTGVPFFLGHTVVKAEGEGRVERVTVAEVDNTWQPVKGTEKTFEVDTVCMAVGLNPQTQLARMARCVMVFAPGLGGWAPAHRKNGETSRPGVFVAGDMSGIEEASSAMIEGRIAGLGAARRAGMVPEKTYDKRLAELCASLDKLREGPFGERVRDAERLMEEALDTPVEVA